MVIKLALIAVGSAAGGVLRYLTAGWGQGLTSGNFPLGTLIVNLAGCFAIGFLNRALTGPLLMREEYRMALTIGLLGGFTTFSAFGWETFSLAGDGQWWRAGLNVGLSVGLGVLAVALGARMSDVLMGV